MKKRILIALLVLFLVLAISSLFYIFSQVTDITQPLASQQILAQNNTAPIQPNATHTINTPLNDTPSVPTTTLESVGHVPRPYMNTTQNTTPTTQTTSLSRGSGSSSTHHSDNPTDQLALTPSTPPSEPEPPEQDDPHQDDPQQDNPDDTTISPPHQDIPEFGTLAMMVIVLLAGLFIGYKRHSTGQL